MRKFRCFLLILLQFSGAVFVYSQDENNPKNIILLIGDGMGVSQVTAAKIVKGKLEMERLNVGGLLTTHAANTLYTDSAAAGTALATGYKTKKGAISVSPDNKPLKTVLEYAEEKGKATGLVASSSLTHATPASFASHVDKRSKANLIAEHITKSGVDVLFGGGWAHFIPKSTKDSKRKDDKDLLSELKKRMTVITSAEEFWKLGDVDAAAGFFAAKHLPKAKERNPGLDKLTAKAIDILSKNKDGFFLMVEGSQIDWAGHKNSQEDIIEETIDFDKAVGVAMDFAVKNTSTLVIVTADHETGGFAVLNGSVKDKKVSDSKFTNKGHTASMVPLFAYGPGSSLFSGINDNTILGKTIIKYLK